MARSFRENARQRETLEQTKAYEDNYEKIFRSVELSPQEKKAKEFDNYTDIFKKATRQLNTYGLPEETLVQLNSHLKSILELLNVA